MKKMEHMLINIPLVTGKSLRTLRDFSFGGLCVKNDLTSDAEVGAGLPLSCKARESLQIGSQKKLIINSLSGKAAILVNRVNQKLF